MPKLTETLAKNLRNLRIGRGLSQQALADLVGIDNQTISNMENGRGNLRVSTLEKLAKTLGVEETAFFQTEGPVTISIDHSIEECARRITAAALKGTRVPELETPTSEQSDHDAKLDKVLAALGRGKTPAPVRTPKKRKG